MFIRQVKAVSIEGHPTAAYNGLYTHEWRSEGWPALKNASGRYCYRYLGQNASLSGSWFLRDKFTPDKTTCSAYIVAKEGPLPVGAHTWQLGPSTLGTEGWEGRTLTVTLLPTEAEVTAAEQRIREGGRITCLAPPCSQPLTRNMSMTQQTMNCMCWGYFSREAFCGE